MEHEHTSSWTHLFIASNDNGATFNTQLNVAANGTIGQNGKLPSQQIRTIFTIYIKRWWKSEYEIYSWLLRGSETGSN